MAVKPGFRGAITLNIASGGALALGIKRGSMRETIGNIDTKSTITTLDAANLLPVTRIQSTKEWRLSIQAQYSAGGAGDPPGLSTGGGDATKIAGNIAVSCQMGDTVAGNFMVEEFENSLDVDGSIDYSLNMVSNGAITRTLGS